MVFILIVLTWLAMQFWGGAAVFQRDDYFIRWHQWLDISYRNKLGETVAVALLLLIPVFALALLLHILGGWFFGLAGVLINIAVLLYACGRGDFIGKLEAYRDSFNHSDPEAVRHAADKYFNLSEFDPESSSVEGKDFTSAHASIRRSISYQAYERWFPVVFWFLILGAPGALFYRLCQIVSGRDYSLTDDTALIADPTGDENDWDAESYAENANAIVGILDWLPSRIWAFGFALCADFNAIMDVLRDQFMAVNSVKSLLEQINLAAIYGSAYAAYVADAVVDDSAINTQGSTSEIDADKAKNELDVMRQINSRVMISLLGLIAVISILA